MKRRLLDIILTDEAKEELARKVLSAIEDGLTAETVRGPQSVVVADNMARMRAAELGVDVLGLAAPRKTEGAGGNTYEWHVHEARFLQHPPSTQPPARVVDVRAITVDEVEPA